MCAMPSKKRRNMSEMSHRAVHTCQQAEDQREVCDVSTKSTPNLGDSDEEYSPPVFDGKRRKCVEVIKSVNMHQLGVNFVERVLDVRRRQQTTVRHRPQENRWNRAPFNWHKTHEL